MKSAPCKDCAERHPGCHSECERYKEYSRERAEIRNSERRINDYYAIHNEQARKAVLRKWRKRR